MATGESVATRDVIWIWSWKPGRYECAIGGWSCRKVYVTAPCCQHIQKGDKYTFKSITTQHKCDHITVTLCPPPAECRNNPFVQLGIFRFWHFSIFCPMGRQVWPIRSRCNLAASLNCTWSVKLSQPSSSFSSRDKPPSKFRVLLTTPGQQSSSHAKLQLVCCDLLRPGQYGVAVVNARSHKRMDECCCWLRIQLLFLRAKFHWDLFSAALKGFYVENGNQRCLVVAVNCHDSV